jgi:hypothetical protein
LLAAILLHDGITERGTEPFKDTGEEQKRLDLLWLVAEHDFRQIVQDITLIPTIDLSRRN